jgi:hypothetical protein
MFEEIVARRDEARAVSMRVDMKEVFAEGLGHIHKMMQASSSGQPAPASSPQRLFLSSALPSSHQPVPEPALRGSPAPQYAMSVPEMVKQYMRETYDSADMEFTMLGQEELLCNAFSPKEDVIAALPTGSGKSAVFEVPAATWDKDAITIVVVPFKSLLAEFVDRNKRRGTKCAKWAGSSTTKTKFYSLLFVSVEVAVQEPFLE